MLAQGDAIRTVERVVVDRGDLRSRPRAMRVSLPYIKLLDETPSACELDPPDATRDTTRSD